MKFLMIIFLSSLSYVSYGCFERLEVIITEGEKRALNYESLKKRYKKQYEALLDKRKQFQNSYESKKVAFSLEKRFKPGQSFGKEFRSIDELFRSPMIIFDMLMELELKRQALREWFPLISDNETAWYLLKQTEMDHGFLFPITYSSSREKPFLGHVKRGHPIDDAYNTNNNHGRNAHRIQWYLIMKSYERDPQFLGGMTPLEVYKKFGDEYLETLETNSPSPSDNAFQVMFDSNYYISAHSAFWLTPTFEPYFPGIIF